MKESILISRLLKQKGASLGEYNGWKVPYSFKSHTPLEEAVHCRRSSVLFDVSHMNYARLRNLSRIDKYLPIELDRLRKGGNRYTVALNEQGGIIDDLIIYRRSESNARGEEEYSLISNVGPGERMNTLMGAEKVEGAVILALQGPDSENVLCGALKKLKNYLNLEEKDFRRMRFMENMETDKVLISRSGYTGEDGFEIVVKEEGDGAIQIAETIMEDQRVMLGGMISRDILRVEAGLCLAGKDFTESDSPLQASIEFAISTRRIRHGPPFNGIERIEVELSGGGTEELRMRKRGGLVVDVEGPAPIPPPKAIIYSTPTERVVGIVTSSTYSPNLNKTIAMGYLDSDGLDGMHVFIRGRQWPVRMVTLPFIPHRYANAGKAVAN